MSETPLDKVEQLRKENAAMRQALQSAARALADAIVFPNDQFAIARSECVDALAGNEGQRLYTREEVLPLVRIVYKLRGKLSEGCNIFFEQDGKAIDIPIDLGEAYQESSLCEEAYDTLKAAAMLGLTEEKA